MTTIDLHPEEMLDAARRGTLGAAATEDLRAHLARCVACRMSLTLADDLRAEASAKDAEGFDDALLARMVRGALADEPRVAYEARPHRRAGSGRHVAVAIALLLVGGSGGAAVWSMGGVGFVRRFVPEVLQLPRREAAPAPVAARASRRPCRSSPRPRRPSRRPWRPSLHRRRRASRPRARFARASRRLPSRPTRSSPTPTARAALATIRARCGATPSSAARILARGKR